MAVLIWNGKHISRTDSVRQELQTMSVTSRETLQVVNCVVRLCEELAYAEHEIKLLKEEVEKCKRSL